MHTLHIRFVHSPLYYKYLPVKADTNEPIEEALKESKKAYETLLDETIDICEKHYKRPTKRFKAMKKNWESNTSTVSRCFIN